MVLKRKNTQICSDRLKYTHTVSWINSPWTVYKKEEKNAYFMRVWDTAFLFKEQRQKELENGHPKRHVILHEASNELAHFLSDKNKTLSSRLGLQNTPTTSLQRVKTSSTSVLKWHSTIWWWGSSNELERWGMRSIPSLPSLPGPLWPRFVAPDRVLSMGEIELNCVFMLNWIAWNRTVLTFKLRTNAK